MQVTVEKASALQRRLTVQVPAEEVQQKIDARLREIGKTARLKGFRPGRIPMKVLQQRYGPSVRHEILTQTMQSSLFEAIEREALRPAASPVIESVPEIQGQQDLEFVATVEVYPELEKIDVSTLEIKQPDTEVGSSDVDDMLETLREQRANWVAADRTPVKGDQVVVEYTAEVDGQKVPESGRQRLSVVIGQSGFDSLENAVTKMNAGDETSVQLDFPDGYGDQQLSGRKAQTELGLVQVQERQIPEVDEDFIKSFGVESGALDDLRTEVRGNLERELKAASTTYLKNQILDALLKQHADLEVPEGIVHDEALSLLKRDAQRRGEEADESRMSEYLEPSRHRVRCGLLMGELARQNSIMIDGARVRQAIETVADTYEQSREVVQMYYNNPELLKSVENAVLEEQVVDWVLEHAKVSSSTMAFKDVINAAAQVRPGV